MGTARIRERPALEIDGWRLHGRSTGWTANPSGRVLVLDYKLSGSVTPRKQLEEKAKLQLQLYMIAVAELWGVEAIGGLYHPLRGTRSRQPRGAVLDELADELGGVRGFEVRLGAAGGLRGAGRGHPPPGRGDRRPDAAR